MVAYGDREDFLQFVRLLPSLGKAKGAQTAKENRAEAGKFTQGWSDYELTMKKSMRLPFPPDFFYGYNGK